MENIEQSVVKQLAKNYLSDLDIYSDPIIIIDAKTNICDMNQYACMLHRCNDKNPIGLSYSQLCEEQQLPNVFAEGLVRLKGKLKPAIIKATYTHDNKEHLIEWKMTPLGEKPDAITGAVLLGKDVTREKTHQDQLDDIASITKEILGKDCKNYLTVNAYVNEIIYHYENIIAQMPGYVYWKDLKGCYRGVNNNIVRAANMPSREACIGRTDAFFAKRLGWKDGIAQSFQENDQMVATTGQQLFNREEPHFTDAQGKEINQLTNKVPLYNRNKQLQGILGISIDITEQKKLIKLEQEKQLLQEDFDNIIENMAGYVYWKDRQGVYVKCNKQVAAIFNFNSCNEITGKTDYDLGKITGVSRERTEKIIRDDKRVMETGIPLLNQEEEPLIDFEGNVFYQLSTRIPLKNKKGEIIGIIGNTLDITDRKRAEKLEKEKRAAEIRVDQLRTVAGSIAHQLTVPLSGVKLAVEYIRKQLPKLTRLYHKAIKTEGTIPGLTKQTINQMDQSILQSSDRIKKAFHLIELHLTNARELNWHTKFDVTLLKPISINSIIDEAINDYPFIDNERMLVKWEKGNDFKVFIEEHLVTHVLFNLIDNALKAIFDAGKGKIFIWLEQNDKHNILHFKDTGIGLPGDERQNLFKPFHTTRNNGTGLGLAFCKTVMKNYGGDIVARGRDKQYAHFILKFPLAEDLQRYKRRYVNDRMKKKVSC